MAPIRIHVLIFGIVFVTGDIFHVLADKHLFDEIGELANLVSLLTETDNILTDKLKLVSSELNDLKPGDKILQNVVFEPQEIKQKFYPFGNMNNETKTRRSTSIPHSVGFSATMTNHNENLNLQDTVKFPNLVTNDGNGYDDTTGIFRAPVSGLYFFNVVILSHQAEDLETEIVKNGDMIVRTYSGDSTTWNAGTQSTVLYLDAGDQVWIRILEEVPSVNNGNVRIFGYGFSSFSGFLIS